MKKNTLKKIDELKDILQSIITSVSKEYYFDYYLINFKSIKGVDLSKKDLYIENTIEAYLNHHEIADSSIFSKLKEYFHNLVKFDTHIYFDDKIIYKELYKILKLINDTLTIQDILNDSKQYPKNFAKIQTDLKKVNTMRYQNKRNLIGDLKQFNRTESRLKYWLATLYVKNRNITKFFLYLFLAIDIKKIKILHEIDKESRELILNTYDWFLMQKTTMPQVRKSLGILLYWEQINFLKIKKDDAEVNTVAIIYELFQKDINCYEFNDAIWIKSSVNHPIFAASKEYNLDENEKNLIKKRMLKELPLDIYSATNSDKFDMLFDIFIKNPHIQFLQKYPVELFRKNPKYSS